MREVRPGAADHIDPARLGETPARSAAPTGGAADRRAAPWCQRKDRSLLRDRVHPLWRPQYVPSCGRSSSTALMKGAARRAAQATRKNHDRRGGQPAAIRLTNRRRAGPARRWKKQAVPTRSSGGRPKRAWRKLRRSQDRDEFFAAEFGITQQTCSASVNWNTGTRGNTVPPTGSEPERSAGVLHRAHCRSDVIAPVAFWRLRYRPTRSVFISFAKGGCPAPGGGSPPDTREIPGGALFRSERS